MELRTEAPVSGKRGVILFALAVGGALLALLTVYVLPMGIVRLALMGLFACLGALFGVAHPKYAVLAVVFYIFGGLTFYFPVNLAPPLLALSLSGALVGFARGDAVQLRTRMFNWVLAFFLLIVLSSFTYAHDLRYATTSLTIFLKSMVVLVLLVQFLRVPRDLQLLMAAIFLGTMTTIFLGILFPGVGVERESKILGTVSWMRFAGARADANVSAVYLIAALPMAAYAMRLWTGKLARVLIAGGIVLILLAVVFTFSRAAVFPLAIIGIVLMIRDVRNRWVNGSIIAIIVTALALTPQFYLFRLQTLGNLFSRSNQDWSIFLRVKALRTAWEMFLDHPFTGVGLNNFTVRSSPDMFVRIPVHNVYLEILVGVGLFGLAAYLLLQLCGFVEYLRVRRAPWKPEHEWMRHIGFYLLISHLAALIGGLFLSLPFAYVIWIPLAGLLAAGRIARRAERENGGNFDHAQG
ncbi:MAG: O-antigen ligase family protein [bacterium]|nr:O-antigen ligase family protein [bacterium]